MICDECQTVAFCLKQGCIPITEEKIMNNQENKASAVPLIERLHSIPKISVLRMEQPKESSTWGIGAMCHEAADALETARAVPIQDGWHDSKLPDHGLLPFSFAGLPEHFTEAAREYAEIYARKALAQQAAPTKPMVTPYISQAQLDRSFPEHRCSDCGDMLPKVCWCNAQGKE